MTMFGCIQADYTNASGTYIPGGTNVYLANTGSGYDYVASNTLAVNSPLPPFLSTNTALTSLQVDIPNVAIQAERVVIGVGTTQLTPKVNDSNGDVTAPTPGLWGKNIYDFFEFSYLPVGGELTLTINTSTVDQFGLPVVLDVAGGSVQPANKVGVSLSRQQTMAQFTQFVANTPYAELSSATRILSPSDQLTNNPVQGLTAIPDTSKTAGGLIAETTYSYAVTALIDSTEACAAAQLAQSQPASDGSIQLSWAGNPAATGYNVYRGTPNGTALNWAQVTNVTATSYTDTGAAGTQKNPAFDPLGNYFDQAVADLFNTTNQPISLTVTDGSSPANGLQYTFTGTAKPAPGWVNSATNSTDNTVIEFKCTSIANNPGSITPLIPLNSLLYVFKPFFNTNTQNPGHPSPPSWNETAMTYANLFPTAMVFGGNGVFADNVQQSAALYNNSNQPTGLKQNAYSVALGSIEDKLDAAILRGISNCINPVNWANAPANNTAVSGPDSGNLSNTQTYYYVVTSLNSSGESTASNETSYTPDNGSVSLSGSPVDGATAYNVYRGTASGQENQLIATTTNTTFSDTLLVYLLPDASPPTSGIMAAPTGVTATLASGGSLAANTCYYVMTTLGISGESIAGNEVMVTTTANQQSVTLGWTPIANASAYKIYRGSATDQENQLIATIPGNAISVFTDTGSVAQNPPPNMYFAPGTTSDLYAQFFHQTNVSIGGLAYADPYDDQGNQSSTITAASPQKVTVTLGNWI
jgi:hypothetical protein